MDSDHAKNLDGCRSLAGYVFLIVGGVVSWKVSLEDDISLFSSEVEYIALTFVTKEAVWLESLLLDLGLDQKSVTIHCDNQCRKALQFIVTTNVQYI